MEILHKKGYAVGRSLSDTRKENIAMQNQRKIVAPIGLSGAGKTEAIDHIVKTYGWPRVYFGDVTFDEMKVRGLEVNEANERMVREGLRAEFGQLVYAERVIAKITALEGNGPVAVESLYSWEEYLRFKEAFGDAFVVIAVHASPAVRYARLANRPKRPLTTQEAQSRDHSQIENLHQAGPIAMADHLIVNEGTKEAFIQRLDEIISVI
jgi:dephospho-CoA kinase